MTEDNASGEPDEPYGIPRFLDSTWAAYGSGTSDPREQIEAGVRYMRDRYGPSAGGASFWDTHGWYR
jgi:hypothetical protein